VKRGRGLGRYLLTIGFTEEFPVKRLFVGCAALLALGTMGTASAFADTAGDNAAAAKKAEAAARADRGRAAHYAASAANHAKAAIDASAAARKDQIARRADLRKHRLAANESRHHRVVSASEHAVSASAQMREQAITDSAHAEKRALDQQH
jgi:hypothetical protein